MSETADTLNSLEGSGPIAPWEAETPKAPADTVELSAFAGEAPPQESPALIHLEHPAAVVNLVDPCLVVGAEVALSEFENEVYPGADGQPPRFLVQFSEWGPVPMVATMVFPREGIPRLSEICAAHGLQLTRAVLTVFNAETKARVAFDIATAVSDLIDTVPEVADIYTFTERTDPAGPLIQCGLHEHELPEFLQ